MAQVSVALPVPFPWQLAGFLPFWSQNLPLTRNLMMLRNEVFKDKTLFSSRAALSSQGFWGFSLWQRGCSTGSLPEKALPLGALTL